MRYKIYCEAPADRDALVTILAKNGYTVRIGKEQKTKNSRYTYYIEYWREGRCSTRWPAATAKSRFARCSPKRKCSAVAGRYRNKFSEV